MSASNSEDDLAALLRSSTRILVIVGAGLSQPSGLPTFRENPEFWGRPVEEVAQASSFDADPLAVWAVYERMRQLAIMSRPNAGHTAVAELAAMKPGLLTISQNIDELLQAANHPPERLVDLHGSLFDVCCTSCNHRQRNVEKYPTVPGLLVDPLDARETRISLPHLSADNIPRFPGCETGVLRPGVTWFGEKLPEDALTRIDAWLALGPVELVLVIGTERAPFLFDAQPADTVYMKTFTSVVEEDDLDDDEWIVNGDVSSTLPQLMEMAFGVQQ